MQSLPPPFDKRLAISYNRGVMGMDSGACCFSGHQTQPTMWAAPSIERIRPRRIHDRMANSIEGFVMSKRIPLTQGQFAIVDDEDHEWLDHWKWYCISYRDRRYAVRSHWDKAKKTRERIRMANAVMERLLGRNLAGLITDHISGDGLDNRRCNLRRCTNKQNGRNRRKLCNSSSRYKGVRRAKGQRNWRAGIRIDGDWIELGSFETEIEAARVYNRFALKHFGEFSRLNILESEESGDISHDG